ncbi:hypothetical protein L228DRAFT_283278 [Xylona heveae TC161]|uniref:Uncharacterized protein n=1 Tax=Xylona heveae (strain CBS 132557 / TC161) TaxID=1328760 RepID=A0A165GEH9_XYLHT|nr:hypothetical protein L228DRAFT_283278 [Xylona heveae TC161]KZF22092.1 hypothetical protein L228DRAFT_283278 [Xylona heveae TC161]
MWLLFRGGPALPDLTTTMSKSSSSLYGIPRPKSSTAKEISSSTTLSFTSQLSSLLANSAKGESPQSSGRTRPSQSKSSIFNAHNKNAKKRALKDLEDEDNPTFSQRSSVEGVDSSTLHRSKRKMEEKARLYAAMKRGDYVPSGGDDSRDERGLVDFDRKWAESTARGEGQNYDTSSGEDDDEPASDEELVEFEDEFGRTKRGTKAEAAREQRRRRDDAADEPDRLSARPSEPGNLIYGDTIQAAAFNPDEPIATRMEDLARNRDKSPTPPEEVHYDASKEVRTKGVGFYGFSKDQQGRKKEMESLEKERQETEKGRREKDERKERRKAEIEERRRKIREQRGKNQAEKFLDGLNQSFGADTP